MVSGWEYDPGPANHHIPSPRPGSWFGDGHVTHTGPKRLHTLAETTVKDKLLFSWNYLFSRWSFWALRAEKGFLESEANKKKSRVKLLIVWNQARWHRLVPCTQQSLKRHLPVGHFSYICQVDWLHQQPQFFPSCICLLSRALTIWLRIPSYDLLWPIRR